MMRKFFAACWLGLVGSILTACGGGGGDSGPGDGGSFQPPQQVSVGFDAQETTLPANVNGLPAFVGSPFITQVDVVVRRSDGTPVANGTVVNVSVSPVDTVALSTLDDPETEENEFAILTGTNNEETSGGRAIFFAHAMAQPGTATITASVQDPNTGNTVSSTIDITVERNPGIGSDQLRITPQDSTVPVNTEGETPTRNSPFVTEVSVAATNPIGGPVPDGTTVQLQAAPVNSGRVAPFSGGNVGGVQPTVEGPTTGGIARFFFVAGSEPGAVTLTASFTDPTTGQLVTRETVINVTGEPGEPRRRFRVDATRTRLPANVNGVQPFLGSPFVSEVRVVFEDEEGQPVPNGTTVQASVFPVSRGAVSKLDDPTTEDNEFTSLFGQLDVDTASGEALYFFHSFNQPGEVEVTFTATDPDTGERVRTVENFTIVESASTALPQQVSFSAPGDAQYIEGSGGNETKQFQIAVLDGGDQPVPDPVTAPDNTDAAFNNVQLELIDDGNLSGETLAGTNAQGQQVSGQQIALATTAGRVSAVLRSGSETGVKRVRAVADAADNNVDNGIDEPVTSARGFVISDGRLFSLQITQPPINSITINRVGAGTVSDDDTGAIPPDPDGTYSQTVSVLALDRRGNPVLPGTSIEFGLIDAPLVDGSFPGGGSGLFALSGGGPLDGAVQTARSGGDPEEGGVDFRAPDGRLTTAGGGAGPGDTLVLFGEEVEGNTDLESSRTVAEVVSPTELTVEEAFNLNDITGSSVDNGPVIPYAIGRGASGNIEAQATTNANGVATTQMNFPVSQLGRRAILWAQGRTEEGVDNGAGKGGDAVETVADAEPTIFPGIEPLALTASPAILPANATTLVTICAEDAIEANIQGATIGFSVENPQGAVVTVDGQQGSGAVAQPTGEDGCTVAEVTASGQAEGSSAITVTFSLGEATASVTISEPGTQVLQVTPTTVIGDRARSFDLRLLSAGGEPVPNVQLTVDCEASGGESTVTVLNQPGTTDSDGRTSATIRGLVDSCTEPGTATCTFSTPSGSPSAEILFQGRDLSELEDQFSPPRNLCPDEDDGSQFTLAVGFGDTASMTSLICAGAAINCQGPDGSGGTCNADFDPDTSVTLTAVDGADCGSGTAVDVDWSGDCQPTAAEPTSQAEVTMDDNKACVANGFP